MMKKIALFLTGSLTIVCMGCSDFLNVAPNKSGSADLYHMDQLLGLTGNSALYRAGNYWYETLFYGDGIGFEPYFVVRRSTYPDYSIWSMDTDYLASTASVSNVTWTSTWNAAYVFNTVLENMDHVIQTTPSVRKQVEGESLFGRAYFQFMALVQYSLWDDDAPGIGYRLDTDPGTIPARETVKFTLDHIYQDLDDAEKALEEAGRTQFEIKRNFRPTVPTVKALRARVDLYRGNYASALVNANAALAAYDYLHDFKNDPLYLVEWQADLNLLDETNSYIVSTTPYQRLIQLRALDDQASWEHAEFYLPHYMATGSATIGTNYLSISESTYNRFDRENDERWKKFYFNNYMAYAGSVSSSVILAGNTTATPNCLTWEVQQNTSEASHHTYQHYGQNKRYLIGLTTAEMYLIKAECLARAGNTSEAAQVLRQLRRARFTTVESANNIGGSIEECLEERAREMTEIWRFYDIKRLNGCENANITIRRTILTTTTDINSTKEVVVTPNDSRWALPFTTQQLILMGWQQN